MVYSHQAATHVGTATPPVLPPTTRLYGRRVHSTRPRTLSTTKRVWGPGGWLLLDKPELHLGEEVLLPDLTGWRRERMPEMPDTVAATLAPGWVCAVLSPSTEVLDREKKVRIYAREGVDRLWLVDPVRQLLKVYKLKSRRWSLQGAWSGTAHVQAEPFQVLTLPLGKLWAR